MNKKNTVETIDSLAVDLAKAKQEKKSQIVSELWEKDPQLARNVAVRCFEMLGTNSKTIGETNRDFHAVCDSAIKAINSYPITEETSEETKKFIIEKVCYITEMAKEMGVKTVKAQSDISKYFVIGLGILTVASTALSALSMGLAASSSHD